jgi:hypothetical protein
VSRRRRGRWGLLLLAATLAFAGPALALPADESILPPEAHAPDLRALVQEHAAGLRSLRADLARCAPELKIQKNGIAFRRPRGRLDGPPLLTLWVWLDATRAPRGESFGARAGEAFGRYGQSLFRHLFGQSPVFADARVGGYGVILTWIGPTQRGGRVVGESLAVFADKVAVANFVLDTIGPAAFLSRVEVRAFDGETELPLPSFGLDDATSAQAASAC